jgi:acyl carrier protein
VVTLCGEPLPRQLVDRIYQCGTVEKVFDLYGPTETTVYATCALRIPGGPVTIGRPIANTTALVLDRHQQPVSVGVEGELYLGGAGVARGYLGRPDLTADRFVENPIAPGTSERLYRTGDQVRWRPDGRLEFLGRLDRQVKIRGFRIELGEIEAVLMDHPAIQDAIVVTKEDAPGDARLVGYIVERSRCDDEDVYSLMARRLPRHMVPAALVRIDAVPRLPNGKLNHAALPDAGTPANRPFVAPRTAIEATIAAAWGEVLRVPSVGIHDHFFAIGGHSLMAMQLVSRLQRACHVPIDVGGVFGAPTVAEQAALVEQMLTVSAIGRSTEHDQERRAHVQIPFRESVASARTSAFDQSTIEERLAEIWQSVLGVPRVGAHEDFFELGGHSLLLMQILSRVRKQFGVTIDLREMFTEPTVGGLARVIETSLKTQSVPLEPSTANPQ